jgi:hypothetical protein
LFSEVSVLWQVSAFFALTDQIEDHVVDRLRNTNLYQMYTKPPNLPQCQGHKGLHLVGLVYPVTSQASRAT